jgi:hypothetical protein
MTLSAGARVSPPVTGATALPPAPTGMAARARSASRANYGADRDQDKTDLLKNQMR